MTIEYFTLITFLGALAAGLLGALTGLGGGIIIIPLLTLGLGVDIHYAIGASLISVMATSSGAAAAYVKEGYTNIRLGMFLEVATTLGAAIGAAFLAALLPANAIAVIFGLILIFSAYTTLRKKELKGEVGTIEKAAQQLKLAGSYPGPEGPIFYNVRHAWAGWGLMGLAGILSGLLGIGSGALKVLAMDQVMGIPFKVSTTTSNFMIGVTAAASAVIYWQRGYIEAGIAAPVMLGVLTGAMIGAKTLSKVKVKWLRWIFSIVITLLAIQMIYNGLQGRL